MITFIVIGISDAPEPYFTPEVLDIIQQGRVFSGGKRHHEIVASLLPADAQWIDITTPLDAVFEKYNSLRSLSLSRSTEGRLLPSGRKKGEIIVFASGDPLFFGFANTIRKKMPEAEIVLYPTFNSLQLLAHRLVMPYHDMHIVSLTGRPWPEFDKALIERTEKIGILTDKEHTPAAIAQRMIDYGYTNYQMHVGEHLGNPELEKVTTLSLEEATKKEFAMPNCIIISIQRSLSLSRSTEGRLLPSGRKKGTSRPFGIPDSDFTLLDGREKMITKMPIRLLTLQTLDLSKRRVFWDIGFCTGSVSIEARLQFPHLQICAFEIRPACEAIIQKNARRFGAPGIDIHMGDFLETDISALPRPDAVFIGGHGGHLKEIMAKVMTVLAPGGIIVFNSVTSPVVSQMTDRPGSRQLWDEACTALHLSQEPPLQIQLNDYNPIEILKATFI